MKEFNCLFKIRIFLKNVNLYPLHEGKKSDGAFLHSQNLSRWLLAFPNILCPKSLRSSPTSLLIISTLKLCITVLLCLLLHGLQVKRGSTG